MQGQELKEVIEMKTKTLSIRINEEEYRFLSSFAKEEKENISNTLRELVELGRVMLAIERYKAGEASLEKAARIAGLSISKTMDILKEHGVEANLEYEDYLKSLKTIRSIW